MHSGGFGWSGSRECTGGAWGNDVCRKSLVHGVVDLWMHFAAV